MRIIAEGNVMKVVSTIGKYFRPVGIIAIGLIFFLLAWIASSDWLLILATVFFVVAGIVSFAWLFRKDKEEEYENWGVAFYFLVAILIIYLFVSKLLYLLEFYFPDIFYILKVFLSRFFAFGE